LIVSSVSSSCFDLAARRGGVEFGEVEDARVLAAAVLGDLLVDVDARGELHLSRPS
jgi:hypothetical protein